MALSDKKIVAAIKNKEFFVGKDKATPIPANKLEFDTISLELHLGSNFKTWKKPIPGEEISANPAVKDFDFKRFADKHTEPVALETDGTYLLKSKHFVLCETYEYVKLSPEICGRVEGKSKFARLGISVHITAPTIQANWGGKITLELYNHSPMDVRLKPSKDDLDLGIIIAQLILEPVEGKITKRGKTFSSDQEGPLGKSIVPLNK